MNVTGKPAIFAIASGKGGVGKTSLTLNMATLLARAGKKVLVVDGDIGLANTDVQLNIHPPRSLVDVIAGRSSVAEALVKTSHGFSLLAGAAGHAGLANLPLHRLQQLLNEIEQVAEKFDVTFIDVAAGVNAPVLALCAWARSTLAVVTPDPSSLTDAYALIKLLWQQHQISNAQVIVNEATQREAQQVHKKLSTAMEAFLKLPAPLLLGNVPVDRLYATAVKNHQLAAEAYPRAAAVEALKAIVGNLPYA